MPRRYVERASALRSVGKALDKGKLTPAPNWRPNLRKHGTTIPHSWIAELAGNCTAPVTIFRDGVYLRLDNGAHIMGGSPTAERPVMTELHVPCRQCENCLRRRAAHWRMRAETEYRAAVRTWFGTLTVAPEFHSRCKMRLLIGSAADAIPAYPDFDTLPQHDQFALRHRMISKEITLYVKRLRKQSEAELRFLCVAEAHKNGLPHYHMLVHEVSPAKPIRHAVLTAQWRLGFSSWKLVHDARSAAYVCKYLAKSSMARVRASLDYGQPVATPLGIGSMK